MTNNEIKSSLWGALGIPDFRDPEASMWNYFMEMISIMMFKSYIFNNYGLDFVKVVCTKEDIIRCLVDNWKFDLRKKFDKEVREVLGAGAGELKNPLYSELKEDFERALSNVEVHIKTVLMS